MLHCSESAVGPDNRISEFGPGAEIPGADARRRRIGRGSSQYRCRGDRATGPTCRPGFMGTSTRQNEYEIGPLRSLAGGRLPQVASISASMS